MEPIDRNILIISGGYNPSDTSYIVDLATAIGQIGASNGTLVIDGPISISTNVTVPSNILLKISNKEAFITKTASATLTINGPFECGLWKCFDGFSDGDIVFGQGSVDKVVPQWWGAKGDDVDDSVALSSWFSALIGSTTPIGGRKGFLPNGVYVTSGLSSNLLNVWSVVIEGESVYGTHIKLKASANKDVIAINKNQTNAGYFPANWVIKNLTIDGNSANNTSGNGIYAFQVDLLRLDNVAIVDCAEYNLYGDTVLGVKHIGPNIWGNTISGDNTKGLGGIYLKNYQYCSFDSTLIARFQESTQWPITLEKTAATGNHAGVIFNNIDLEGNKNGVKTLFDGSAKAVFNNTQFWGLGSNGGTLFDITASDNKGLFEVIGGMVLGSWNPAIKTSVNATGVSFKDVDGFTNNPNYTNDLGGIKLTHGDYDNRNFVLNGSMEHWDSADVVPLGLEFEVTGCTYSKEATSVKSGLYAFKMISTTTTNFIQKRFSGIDANKFKGKIITASGWAKGTTANSANILIVTAGGAAPSALSDSNRGTSFEHLFTMLEIPSDVTDIYVRYNVPVGKTAIWDDLSISINSVSKYYQSSNSEVMYGAITWDPSTILDGAGSTSSAITVLGAIFGDEVTVSAPYDLQGATITGYVSSAGNVKIRIQNESGGNLTFASGVWNVTVRRTAAYVQ